MTGVFIAANRLDKKMWKTLPNLLCRNLPAMVVPPGKPAGELPRDGLVISDVEYAAGLHPDNAIIVFKEMATIPCCFPAGERTVAVVDSGGAAALLEKVRETMLPAITCGLSTRDTLTLSSIAADSAVVTLQRSLTCFDGSTAEPQEIPLALRAPIDSFTLMAATAVFFLSGNAERLRTAEF